MQSIAFVMPILPGKEETDLDMFRRLNTPGPDRDAHLAARRAQSFTREAVWHQQTPMGTFAIVLLEGEDIQASLGQVMASDDAYAQGFRQFVKEVHGVDLAGDPPPAVTPVSDTRF